MTEEQVGYSFKIEHAGDEEFFSCWEGLSLLLILTGTALEKGLDKELNELKRRVWYIDEDDDNKEKEIDVGIFDIAITWLRGHINTQEDLFRGYIPDKLIRTQDDDEA